MESERLTDDSAQILWRRLDFPGHEAMRLFAASGGWILEGNAAFVFESLVCALHYTVRSDRSWQTRSARIAGWAGPRSVDIQVDVDQHHWTLNGAAQPEVDGCIDVDLSFTPSTNTLPIRRLALPIGAARQVTAAWLRFPELTLERLDQSYSRVSESTYEYAATGGAFRALLTVNPAGLVTNYPGLWREAAEHGVHPLGR